MTKLMVKRRKMVLSLTPQPMHNQFKRPSVGSVSELHYIYTLRPKFNTFRIPRKCYFPANFAVWQ